MILHGIEAWERNVSFSKYISYITEYWAVSDYTKNRFQDAYQLSPQKVKRIFNTLPEDWPQHSGTYNNFFLSVSRLDSNEKYKGIEETLRAISFIKKTIEENEFKYIIVASGDDLDRHKQLVHELNIEQLVVFKSSITDEDLQTLYKNCSFFILPSTGEGFGIVYLEAMAMEKPCIGARNCGAETVIEHYKTGYLVDRDPTKIGDIIQELIINKALCLSLGKAGRDKLNKDFTFSKFKIRINQLVGGLTNS
jgi:glycosyltransferase involved in cell wall biosynthesis